MVGEKTVIGILAHVDAGKTTLSEALLHLSGVLRKLGRVDHKNAYLDNFSLERERGITIFSKQANLAWKDLDLVLLDTPGHVDFSAEMERTLQVLDYCILVISGADGVQGHTATLWRLLKKYRIPTFIFVNKMDQPGADKKFLLAGLQRELSGACIGFMPFERGTESFYDSAAMCSESLMEEYLETGALSEESLKKAIAERELFPVFFGSALKLEGVEALLDGLNEYIQKKEYPDVFGARVYKITRDASGGRLTHMKITGGTLRVRMPVGNENSARGSEDLWSEKVSMLRIYSGGTFKSVEQANAGEICTVSGLTKTFAGQGLGFEGESEIPVLSPILTYRLVLPQGADPVKVLGQMRQLEEEEPELQVVWQESIKEIHMRVMGEVQTEILTDVIAERFGLEVSFADGRLLYKETIASPAVGIGHFEPLRHYAEVHLLLEPGEPGSGITLATLCSEDDLDKNWQRLIFTHLEEKTHLGVLTGSPLTDVKITLLIGRAHIKHTEGGDFRQATYRAIRQGLMQCENVLLEPVFSFTLEVPTDGLGRAMTDIQKMSGSFEPPVTGENMSILQGSAPAALLKDYQKELNAYSRGHGRLNCSLKGYEPCHNTEEVLAAICYDPENDSANPSSSVFCSHGAGFVVQWNEVPEYAHLLSPYVEGLMKTSRMEEDRNAVEANRNAQSGSRERVISQEEIDRIFLQTYRKTTSDYEPYRYSKAKSGGYHGTSTELLAPEEKPYKYNPVERTEEYFLVDGYNIIFAWDDLRNLSELNIDSARDKLIDICCNYQGFIGATLILVFDAYKVKGNPGSVQQINNIYVVYTKEAETADAYIEKTVHKLGKKHKITVATSDGLVQMIIWGAGASRMSAAGFREAVENAGRRLREEHPDSGALTSRIVVPTEQPK